MTEIIRDVGRSKAKSFSRLGKWRWAELTCLVFAAAIVGFGLFLVYQAKTTRAAIDPNLPENENMSAILADDPEKIGFNSYSEKIEKKEVVNLNIVRDVKGLLPVLKFIESENERAFIAGKIVEIVKSERLPNLRRLSLSGLAFTTRGEIERDQNLEFLNEALGKIRKDTGTTDTDDAAGPFNVLQPFMPEMRNRLVVREPAEFRNSFLFWALTFFGIFFAVNILWSVFALTVDQFLLPIVFVLCGLGFILMTTIHDPLRDSLFFAEFAKGGLIGIAFLLLFSFSEHLLRRINVGFRHFMQIFDGRKMWIPLGIAAALSVLLLTVGNGPGGGAKVNLFSVQPSEFIKILAVVFFASYFAENHVLLQNLRDRYFRGMPRLVDIVPITLSVAVIFLFFNLQKDLGPALIIITTFLVLYSVARRKIVLLLFGAVLFGVLLAISYYFAEPFTVYERVMIWLNVWENGLERGHQVARGFWALASGGFFGTGLGLGDPSENTIPAGHTDLVLAAIGEEIGFVGVALVLVLYCILILRFLRISVNARRDVSFFLGLGLTMIFAVQIVLIVSGVLGLFPLTGVVNPFLSWGKSSMIANFIILGLLAAISADSPKNVSNAKFKLPVRAIALVFIFLMSIFVVQAYRIQSWNGDENVAKGILTKQKDGEYRFIYNPRLLEVAKLLPKGTIFDINGIPLATSDCQKLAEHRAEYEKLGYPLDQSCVPGKRQYPFYKQEGLSLFHILGDARSRKNWQGRNLFIEREQELTLQGFDDSAKELKPEDKIKTIYEFDENKYQVPRPVKVSPRDLSEIVPLLRYRHYTGQSDLQRLWNKPRDVRTTIDVRMQLETARIVEQTIKAKKLIKAAAVVVDPVHGNVLASVSYPWFSSDQLDGFIKAPERSNSSLSFAEKDQIDMRLADRARLDGNPPGSTFKILTAIAALRKDPNIYRKTFKCGPLAGGGGGVNLPAYGRLVHDDENDIPHGNVSLRDGIIDSCNAYFSQLGVEEVKDSGLWETSKLMGTQFAMNRFVDYYIDGKKVNVDLLKELKDWLPQATFGQYPVNATPLQMAEVASTIANQGVLVNAHWLIGDTLISPIKFIDPDSSQIIADAMRGVVTEGTATGLRSITVEIAGKTGTAQVPPKIAHSWFIGFAPYRGTKKLAFAVLFENGGYGSATAVPAAGEIVKKAFELRLME